MHFYWEKPIKFFVVVKASRTVIFINEMSKPFLDSYWSIAEVILYGDPLMHLFICLSLLLDY